jgi:hypothetical protein
MAEYFWGLIEMAGPWVIVSAIGNMRYTRGCIAGQQK